MEKADRNIPLEPWIDRRSIEVADQAVQAESLAMSSAFAENNVQEIENIFYRVFRRIYVAGREDAEA